MGYPDPRLIPIAKVDVEGVEPGAATNILASGIAPSMPPSMLRIHVCVDAVTLFYAVITVGETTRSIYFNAKADLTADALHEFFLLIHTGDSVNFQIDSAEGITHLRVQEIPTSI